MKPTNTKLQVIQNSRLKITLSRNILYRTVDLHIEAKLLPCKYRRLIMLQKTTFSGKRDIRTRAHDAISLYVPLPKSELFKKIKQIL